ncbi:putative heparinase superfamily protein [Falsochrobactrum ovis]|uniref:Putative heparinase superfamily protein n=1 Tax=Falsochrobactrum ovis TaxID=1293442 RepID=A0A364JW03_9HYPH|nr:putative heparinase superfamily protein [Falsochrobactrum ovis]
MAVALSETPHLWGLAVAQAWRRLSRRLRMGPLYRWRFTGFTPERILITPPDLRVADPQLAQEFYHGRFALAGRLVETGGRSPFAVEPPTPEWEKALHGFGWLRHLKSANTELATANARVLVDDWMRLYGKRIGGIAWTPEVTAQRIIAWLQHSDLILTDTELSAYRKFMRSLAMQVRYLRTIASAMDDGEERLRARIALAFAALALPVSPPTARAARRNLEYELKRQILPDGGHISRNPATILELLADLLPLRQTYASGTESPPKALIEAVERMLPALRFFRHQDGNLALFNGVGPTMPERIISVLRHDETGGKPLTYAPYSGYERLSMGATTIIADTGLPPPVTASRDAHSGCLSFEMSSGRQRYIVNSGIDRFGPTEFRPLGRSTAAHSTATINDTSSCRFSHSKGLSSMIGTPIIAGPTNVQRNRVEDTGRQGFVASHDGYVRLFGIYHERRIVLSHNGSVIQGMDHFYRGDSKPLKANGRDNIAVRFHIHPSVDISLDENGLIILSADQDDTWAFSCFEIAPQLEDSIFFAGFRGPVTSKQIVLSFPASELPEVNWQFSRIAIGSYT